MTDPDAELRALLSDAFADPPHDPAFVARVEALVRADALYAEARRRAWRRFGAEAAGALAVAGAASVVVSAPAGGWALALLAGALPAMWVLAACRPNSYATG